MGMHRRDQFLNVIDIRHKGAKSHGPTKVENFSLLMQREIYFDLLMNREFASFPLN